MGSGEGAAGIHDALSEFTVRSRIERLVIYAGAEDCDSESSLRKCCFVRERVDAVGKSGDDDEPCYSQGLNELGRDLFSVWRWRTRAHHCKKDSLGETPAEE